MTALARPKFLSIRNGQKWLTAKGREIEIISLDLTGKTDFPISAIYSDDSRTNVSFGGATADGDQLAERVLLPAPELTATDQYYSDAIDDELTIAALRHWHNFARPLTITPTVWIQGTHNAKNGHKVRNGSVPMPMWRRSWSGAGDLVARCELSIATSLAGVAVHAETGPTVRALYDDHPSKDHAIWFVMCKAAIAYLEAK